jgi:hypothetical protein
VVDVHDAARGTVRVKRSIDELDVQALDAHSTKTTRTRKPES